MDLVLINPESTSGAVNPIPETSEGCLSLCRDLLEHGFSVALVHEANHIAIKKLRALIDRNTIAVGISTLSGTMLRNALILAQWVRDNYPNMPLVWGGVHPTMLPEQTLEDPLVDYLVYGEGEDILVRLLHAIKDNSSVRAIPGVCWKDGDLLHINKRRSYTNLNTITTPLPYHLLDMSKYSRPLAIGGDRWYDIMTSRGCPHRCTFCSNHNMEWKNNRIRNKAADSVLADIHTLSSDYGADGFTLMDVSLSPYQLKRLTTFLPPALYRVSIRADELCKTPPDTLAKLRDVGFISIGLGIETGSQRMLDYLHKDITIEQIHQANKLLDDFGFYKSFSWMSYFPTETRDDLIQSSRLALHLLRTSKSSPYPLGTVYKTILLPKTELLHDVVERYGYRSPNSLREWVGADDTFDGDVHESSVYKVARTTWMTQEMADATDSVIPLIEQASALYTGKDRDDDAIDVALNRLQSAIDAL